MQERRKWISVIVLVAFLCTIMPLPALAAEVQDGLTIVENEDSLFTDTVTVENTTEQGVQFVDDTVLPETTAAIIQEGTCGENLTWTLTEDGVLTISGTGEMAQALTWSLRSQVKELVIEEGVTGLYDYAFESCTALAKITFPSSMEVITKGAFSSCTSLTNVILPDGVIEIGDYAFVNCTSLISIYIPESVTTIGKFPFSNCEKVAIYGVADSQAEAYAVSQNIPFSSVAAGEDGTIIYLEQDKTVIPIGDTGTITAKNNIGEAVPVTWSVADSSILEIVMESSDGSSVQLKGLNPGVTVVTVTANGATTTRTIEVVGNSGSCGENATWNLTDGVLNISGTGTITDPAWLQMRENITSVVMEDGITDIGYGAFESCINLKSVKLSNQLTTLGLSTFHECASLEAVTLPESITEIGVVAFRNCTSLTSIVIPKNVTVINEQTFYGCTALTNVTLPEGLISIGTSAFGECKQLSEINIPSTVTSIGVNAFYNCAMLRQIVLPNGLKTLGRSAFNDCTALENITIPQGLTEIAESAFYGCSNLSNVIFPSNITKIGYNAFGECTSFTSIIIPESITQIDKFAFGGCTNIKEIYFLGDMLECTSDTNVDFLDGTLEVRAYYPANNPTWDLEKLGQMTIHYGGYGAFYIDWQPFDGLSKVSGIELNQTDATVAIGDELQLIASILPATATNKNVTWESSNPTVATVSDAGVVTPLETGSTIITVTTEDGGYTASCRVSVKQNENDSSGYCGDNIHWTLETDTGLLTLKGTGAIKDFYPDSTDETPSAFGKAKKVVIEDGITRIGNNLFYGRENIEELTIADSVTSIGYGAFVGCDGLRIVETGNGITTWNGFDFGPALEHIMIGVSLTEISDSLFEGCIGLEEIQIPDNIVYIGDSAFSGCTGLTSLILPDTITTIGEAAFSNCIGLTNMRIPDAVTSLGAGAFSGCTELTQITIGEGISCIQAGSFYECVNLSQIHWGNNIKNISGTMKNDSLNPRLGGAFEGCTALRELEFPQKLETIGDYVFSGCTALTDVSLPDSVVMVGKRTFAECTSLESFESGYGLEIIRGGAFYGCINLKNIDLGESLTTIEDGELCDYSSNNLNIRYGSGGAFENCTSVTNINFPKSLRKIGTYGFQNCVLLQEIILPNTVTTIGNHAFEGCTAIETIMLSDGLTELPTGTFEGCNNIRYVETGNGLINLNGFHVDNFSKLKTFIIGDNVADLKISELYNNLLFKGNTSLEKVVIGRNVTNITKDAFAGCTSLSNLTIEDGVSAISENAFKDCVSLPQITIPDSVTRIDTGAFSGCTGLEVVDTGDGITNLDGFEFAGSTVLRNMIIGNSVTEIPANKFSGCSALANIVIGTGVQNIRQDAFKDCTSLIRLMIPDNVINILTGAFSGCTNLRVVDIGNGVKNLDGFDFANSTALYSINIGDSVTEIPSDKFNGCSSLKYVTMGSGTKEIGIGAFKNCTALTDLEISSATTLIDSSAFENNTALSSVTLPSGLKAIGSRAFSECASLKNIRIPETVSWIGSNAFLNCELLTNVKIPDSVTHIGADAYAGCSGLKNIIISEGVSETNSSGDYNISSFDFSSYPVLQSVSVGGEITKIPTNTFSNCNALVRVILGQGTRVIEGSSFVNCPELRIVVIPDTVTTIAWNAFSDCTNLKLYGYTGSEAERYAKAHEIPFTSLTTGDIPSPDGTIISIVASMYDIGIGEGNATNLRCIITPDEAQGQEIGWSIADESVVRITSAEIGGWWLEGLQPGTTTITATTENGASSTRTVTVNGSNSSINGTTVTINGDLVCIPGEVSDVYAFEVSGIAGMAYAINWLIADNSIAEIQEILSDGTQEGSLGTGHIKIKGLKEGETTITATTEDGASCTRILSVRKDVPSPDTPGVDDSVIPIKPTIPMTGIDISPNVEVGQAIPLHAYYNSTGFTLAEWSIKPSGLAYLTEEDEFIGLKPGQVTITAKSTKGELTKQVTITAGKQRPYILAETTSLDYRYGAYEQTEIPFYVVVTNNSSNAIEEQLRLTTDLPGMKFKDKWLFFGKEVDELTTSKVTLQPGEAYVFEGTLSAEKYIPTVADYKIPILLSCERSNGSSFTENFVLYNYDSTSKDNPDNKPVRPKPENVSEAQKAAKDELDKLTSNLVLSKTDGLENYLDEAQRRDLQRVLLTWITIAGNDVFSTDVQSKIWERYIIKNKSDFGFFKTKALTTCIVLRVSTITDGERDIKFTANVSNFGSGEKNIAQFATIDWELLNSDDLKEQGKPIENRDTSMAINADTATFYEKLEEYADEKIKEAYDEVWGDLADGVIAELLNETFLGTVIEVQNISVSDGLYKLMKKAAKPQRRVTVKCPVDVYIYGDEGTIIGSIKNNVVDEGITQIPMWVDGDTKNFILFDEEYDIELIGNDSGSMNYIIEEYADGETVSRTVEFLDLPLEPGKTYTGTLEAELYVPNTSYALTSDAGEVILCDTDILHSDISSSVSGTVTSYGADDTITLELTNGTDTYTTTTVGGNQTAAEFAFTDTIPAGEYTLTVKKAGHADYTETITVGTDALVKTLQLYLLGDVNGDGTVTAADMQNIYAHMNGNGTLVGAALQVADVNKDGFITAADMQSIYNMMNSSK